MSVRVADLKDMARIEEKLCQLLGGDQRKSCALVRTKDFISLRLCALYNHGKAPMSAYYQNVQVSLDADKTVAIYLLSMNPVETTVDEAMVLGKRRQPDSPEDEDEF